MADAPATAPAPSLLAQGMSILTARQEQKRAVAAANEAAARAKKEAAWTLKMQAQADADRLAFAQGSKVPGWVWAAAVIGVALVGITFITRPKK